MTNRSPEGSGAAAADAAPAGSPAQRDEDSNAPHARSGKPLDPHSKPDQLSEKDAEDRQEALLDEGIEETFPASDPVSAKRIT